MENIVVRNIKEKDIPKVVDIQISGWKTAYKGIVDDDYLKKLNKDFIIEKRINDYNKSGFIVAEINSNIVGFCRYINNNKYTPEINEVDCELMAIYVDPNMKHNGIGTKMFQYVVDEFKKNGKTKMILWCLKDNKESRKFYEKMGGIIVGEHNIRIEEKIYKEVGFKYNLK